MRNNIPHVHREGAVVNPQATNENKYLEKGDDLLRNVSAQAYICSEGGSPARDQIADNLITAVGVVESLASFGGFSGPAEFVASKIEDSFTPNAQKLARCASNVYRKNLAQLGFNIFVRVRYEKFGVTGWGNDKWTGQLTQWELYDKGGYGDGVFHDMSGSYESMDDVKINVRKAMKWEIIKFLKGCKKI